MVRLLLHGCNGKMGQVISSLVEEDPEVEIAAGIDTYLTGKNSYPVFQDIKECTAEADCLIDFYVAGAVEGMLAYCVEKGLPCVVCTTGLDEAMLTKIEEASVRVAVLKSANMSLGINLLLKMIKEAAGLLAPAGFDMEIVEKHHNRKIDSPSGTALALADSINEEFDGAYEYIYDRSSIREKRGDKEIGISAVRGGTIVGEHDVLFAGIDEVITFSHTAYSRNVFAKGAVQAAKFLAGKEAGYYDMSDVINA